MGPATHALHIALAYAGRVALATLAQCALVLGPPLLLAAVMQPVALRSEQWTRRLVGERAHWVAAGWLSTALHEGGHAALALLFGHRVTRVKWFDFAAEDGALGQVDHEFAPTSFYQRVGRFFIGIAPIVLAALVIAAAARFLLGVQGPPARTVAHGSAELTTVTRTFATQLGASVHAVGRLAMALHADRWRTWIFLYLAYVGGSAMRLSGSDLRSAGAGMWTLGCLLLLANALTLWAGTFATTLALRVTSALALCDAALLAAIALQLLVGAVSLAITHAAAYFRARDAALARG